VLAICWAIPAAAWTITGHTVVVDLAARLLSDRARAQIDDLLEGDDLADHAMWADNIVSERPETDPWHSVDIPHDGERYDAARDCQDGQCIVGKINEFTRTLADRTRALPERAEALKYLIHFVADLHMPFHAYAPGPADDLWKSWDSWEGPWIQDGQRAWRLHLWWDWRVVRPLGPGVRHIVNGLWVQIGDADVELWTKATPEDWANESFAIARAFVVRHGLADPRRLEGNSESKPTDIPFEVIGEATSIAAERLKMAAVRLAALLNRALAD
jgi:hypothetical protein